MKQKIDQFLSKHEDIDLLVEQARNFLIGREDKLVNARKNALEAAARSSSTSSSTERKNSINSEPFSRGNKSKKKKQFLNFFYLFLNLFFSQELRIYK